MALILLTCKDGERDMPVEYAYTQSGRMSFSEAIEAVEREVRAHGFVVYASHDIREAVVAKGFAIRPLVIMEIRPEGDEGGRPRALKFSCRISIYEDNGVVVVSALRPTVVQAVYSEHDQEHSAEEVERIIISIVDSSVA